ncbi:Uu.00g066670.m01.CDS01 [Anthostomella pinea]|uniref:serine--tRNA ligase n=1 Tax=Anthostomella pinea TaxID=933095 RepID=A0AAI8YKW8_9PEZI|nr:Uu.00g066670.m01.CDS01 [Anthostomella pinea]
MRAPRTPFVCLQCRLVRPRSVPCLRNPPARLSSSRPTRWSSNRSSSSSHSNTEASSPSNSPPAQQQQQRPTTAPRPNIDIKHIRQNAALHEQNCLERNYKTQSTYPAHINALFAQWQARQHDGRSLRERSNALRRQIANPATLQHEDETKPDDSNNTATATTTPDVKDIRTMTKPELLEEARQLKTQLSAIEEDEARLTSEMSALALAIPNLTSATTPRGAVPRVLSYINEHPEPAPSASDRVWRSHVHIGSELGILDFAGAATSSGWGWYYLVDEGAALEQALIAYALAGVTRSPGWRQVAPPSIVYSHIAGACGFQPRDQHGEQQVYTLAQSASDAARGRPELSLAATAEIPLAGLKADCVLLEDNDTRNAMPLKTVAASRCYRAEAGARGVDTKGLYRVHEFTKVEMFAWTPPSMDETLDVFDEMVDLQTEILQGLGLHCRVLEMPSADLGASAVRKIDIEAFFPSRRRRATTKKEGEGEVDEDGGWGEVTSASICTDYQTRRLATRLRTVGGKMVYPWTVNGTALAVPRVLAAVLENGWDENEMAVTIPEVLRPWMGGREKIGLKHRRL